MTTERDVAVALYRLQIELRGLAGRARGRTTSGAAGCARSARRRAPRAPELDIRLIVAALDGLRLSVLLSGEDPEWLRDAVRRQLQALLG